MGWYVTEAIRLMRDDWPKAKQLAEELYAMLTGTNPVVTNAPLQINSPAGVPPFQLGNYSNGDSLFEITRPNGEPFGRLAIEDGNLLFTAAKPIAQPNIPTPSGGGGGGIPAMITDGSGDAYTATIYPAGLSGPTQSVQVKQLQIDPTDTIPAGTWTHAFLQADGQYTMQVPIWLSD